jgi:phosphatidylinositol dimannoside acyltransferase
LKILTLLRRFSVYGDFWMRLLHWGARSGPWYLEPVMMAGCSVLFWLACTKQRNAVAENLLTILPGSSPAMNQLRALRVFWNFAWTMTDLSHVRHGERIISWEIIGKEYLNALERSEHGAILLTAHMGNYDVAGPVFAHHFKNPIHIVRAPERHQKSQEFQQEGFEKQTPDGFVIHYNQPGNMIGVELAKALQEGGLVAIQGDRVLFDVAPMELPYGNGMSWSIPRGPFTLALVARTAIHPIFIIRMGYRRYQVVAGKPITMTVIGRDKEGAQREAARQWTEVMRHEIAQHWRQWFVFEPVFKPNTNAS